MSMRRFEFTDDKSNKFWEIENKGTEFHVKYGKIGAAGQNQVKSWPSEAKCKTEYDKLVAEKVKKGYKEIGADDGE